MVLFLFYVFAFLAVALALTVVVIRNPMHSAVSLFGFFFMVSAIFILLQAEFVAVVQLFVYAGGILVLYLFILMFVDLQETELARRRFHDRRIVIVFLVLLMMVGFWVKIVPTFRIGPSQGLTAEKIESLGGNVEALGKLLFQDYFVPFEIASIVLLVGMIGAVVLGRGLKRRDKESEA